MALIESHVLSRISGAMKGTVFSHNQGGAYMRGRTTPTNPNTEPQQVMRSIMSTLNDAWTNELTNAQRAGWETYAFNTPMLNRMGALTKRSGQNMFIRSNAARLQALLDRVDVAPTVFDLGTLSPVGAIIADASADTLSIAWSGLDDWSTEDDSALLVYQSRPQNGTKRFFKGPYQLANAIAGNNAVSPVPPTVFASLFPLEEGQRVFLKLNVTRADGRYTTPQLVDTVVVP